MTRKALKEAHIEVLKRAIATRHAELLSETGEDVARARAENYAALAGPVTDRGDEASADLLADLGYAEVARDLRELNELKAALARIDAGTYGICATCGAEIDFGRLRAHPVATRCTACQATHERASVGASGPSL